MKYNFDEPVARQGTNSVKYDSRKDIFGTEDLIPMWVADMDFKCPPAIIEALKKRLDHEILGYTIRRDEYFTSLQDWLQKRYSWNVKKEWISFSPGIVPALNICVLAYTQPGDKIIIQPPVYFPFFNAVTDHGRELVLNQLSEKDGYWSFDLADLEQKAAEGAKMLILSNPHNPVGRAWKGDELKELAGICRKYGLIILSDEIHSDLVLPGNKHTVMASLSGDIADITITCMAPSKTFNIAGLSTSSMIISNKELKEQFDTMIGSLHITGGNIFGTEASIAAYSQGSEWLDELLVYINNNIDYVIDSLGSTGMIKPIRPEATYMIWLDCRNMGMGTDELNKFFIEKASVGMSAGAIFGPGGEGYMRMNIACPLDTVKKAVDNIEKALSALQGNNSLS
ncbi:MAG: PatB family C-S lyase [Bacteroidales bacterium]|nr:PatB family C-S lyase [Bacteroidales bacterium]